MLVADLNLDGLIAYFIFVLFALFIPFIVLKHTDSVSAPLY